MTTLIYYTGKDNFPVLLTQLQPQLSQDDDIYVVDITPNRKGVDVVNRYGSSRCYIFVEVGDYSFEQAEQFALENMQENKQEGLLVISENAIISSTFIANIKRASKLDCDIFSPAVISASYVRFPSSFKWYNQPVSSLARVGDYSNNCYYRKADKTNENKGFFAGEVVVVLDDSKSAL